MLERIVYVFQHFFICAYSVQKIALDLWWLLIINQLLSSFFSISLLCYFT